MNMKQQQIVTEEGDLRRYFAQIPNLADDTLGLHEYRLYGHYKRICGANGGVCTEGLRKTAKHCGMGTTKVVEARQWLHDNGWIVATIDESDPEATYHIVIKDIWDENFAAYAKPKAPTTEKTPIAKPVQSGLFSVEGGDPIQDQGASNGDQGDPIQDQGRSQIGSGVIPDRIERITTTNNYNNNKNAPQASPSGADGFQPVGQTSEVPKAETVVETFRRLQSELESASNRQAKLMEIYQLCFGTNNLPSFPRLGASAKKAGGAGFLSAQLWELTTRPPKGNPLDYLDALNARSAKKREAEVKLVENSPLRNMRVFS